MDYNSFMKKHKLKDGDLISINTDNETYEGYLIPNKNFSVLALKLKSGYNIGVKIKNIKKVLKKHGSKKVGKSKSAKLSFNKELPTISILQIGGTISGRVDYRTGAVRVDFGPEELISMYPELEKIANFNTKLIGKMWSEDMRFAHHIKLAEEIEKEVKKGGIKGIILPHGTDTMTYTSASLAFMLENLPIPVLLVGAQRSPDRASSDAAMNLICASEFITKTDFKGIGICMHESTNDDYCVILSPTKTRKLHTSRRDAFRPVNDKAIARISYKTKEIKFLKPTTGNKDKKEFIAKCKLDEKVALLKAHPNLMPDQILFFKTNNYKGLVLEGTGLGQIPVGVPDEDAKINSKNLKAIKELIESGCVIVMTSQCIFGRVQMHVYEGAVDLVNAGVIPGEDMLSETALVKLSWLLGNYPKEKVKELINKNIRGEIREHISYENVELE